MVSFTDLPDEEQRRALQREAEILQDLEAAKEMERSCYRRETKLRTYGELVRGASHQEHNRAVRNLESAKRIVESLSFDLMLYRLQRNDKDTIVIDCKKLPQGYGEPLGKALMHNTVVTTLALTVHNFLPAGIQTVIPAAQPLLDFVSTSPSLVNVRVQGGNGQGVDRVATCLVETACASNSVQKLLLFAGPVTPMEFKSLLTKPPSLRELDVSFADQRWTDEEKQCVTEGLKANQNRLERLTLTINNGSEDDGDMPTHVLQNVHLVHSLQDLVLELASGTFEDPFFGAIDVFSALDRYLKSVDALRRLEFVQMHICESSMRSLLSGLGQTTANVSEVTFDECSFATGSCDQLFAFLQTPTTNVHGTTIYKSALRKLRVGLLDQDDLEDLESWEKRLAESLLVPVDSTPPGMVQTVGSQIEELHISDVHPSFLHCMGSNASRVQVKHWGFYGSIPDTISECLPKLGSVTSLTMKNIYVEPMSEGGTSTLLSIVEGLKHNNSITVISTGRTAFGSFSNQSSLSFEPDCGNNFDEKQLRLMDAYALRNKFLSSYKIGQTSASDDKLGTADSAPIDASNSSCGSLEIGVSQAPSVLRSAMIGPVPHLWHGLVKAGEQCGPDHHGSTTGSGTKRRLPT